MVSELSGRSNVLSKAEELGLEVSAHARRRGAREIKELEAKGFAYEAAEASVALLMARQAARLPAALRGAPLPGGRRATRRWRHVRGSHRQGPHRGRRSCTRQAKGTAP